MINIDEICSRLQSADADIGKIIGQLETERGWLNETISRVQANFGDQQVGQALIAKLYQTLENIQQAGHRLYQSQAEIKNYISYIRR